MDPADQPDQPDPRAGGFDLPEQVRDQGRRLTAPLFRFTQFEIPWALGPPDGRYLVRGAGDEPDAPSHVLVLSTLAAQPRHLVARRRRAAAPEPAPAAVPTSRATVIGVGAPLSGPADAEAWLARAGEEDVSADLAVLNRALHGHRLVTADPYVRTVSAEQAIVTRVGYGAGEQVADGQWTSARELARSGPRRRRLRMLAPHARLPALLGGHQHVLACEELVLRARLDLDQGREREAALQAMIALDAALAELAVDPTADALRARLAELRAQREPVTGAAQAALAGSLTAEQARAVAFAVGRLEAALRARAAEAS